MLINVLSKVVKIIVGRLVYFIISKILIFSDVRLKIDVMEMWICFGKCWLRSVLRMLFSNIVFVLIKGLMIIRVFVSCIVWFFYYDCLVFLMVCLFVKFWFVCFGERCYDCVNFFFFVWSLFDVCYFFIFFCLLLFCVKFFFFFVYVVRLMYVYCRIIVKLECFCFYWCLVVGVGD